MDDRRDLCLHRLMGKGVIGGYWMDGGMMNNNGWVDGYMVDIMMEKLVNRENICIDG